MKKVFAVTKVAALLTVFLFFTLFITTCGGGAAGGAGGASIPDSEYSTHNAGGWGGGGNSGGSGGSSTGGNGVNMTGGTPLFVERYEDPVTGTFAGSQLNDLIAAIQNNSSRSNSVFNIPFYVVGDPVVRQARVTKGRTKVEKFEHQYKATCSIPPSTTPSVFYYYVDEGINLATITTAEMTGWQCLEDGSIHNGSHITNITGDVSLVPVYANGAGPINAGVIKTDLHTAAIPDVGEIWDYEQYTGIQDGTAYITVPPPPMTALYNENESAVTWSGNYVVNININSTPIEFTFSSGETQSKQITNIPVGATISASATINVTGSSRYASLTTPQLSTTVQAGGNLDMYFSYPYTCHIPSSLQSYTAVSGVNSGAYKNNGTPTDISSKRPTQESFEYNGQTLYFIGWSRNAADTVPEIAGDSIPANGTYHGALDLYAIFSSCSVSISIHDQTGLNSNILAESSQNDHITLTASTAGDLPENSTYSWTIERPSSNPPVSLSSDSGQSITVTPVTGRTGSATIKVTASGGGHTASKTIDVQVVAIALQETLPIVLEPNETATLHASVVGGYSGGIDYSWQVISGSSVSVPNNNSSDNTITANSGGKTTIRIGAELTANDLGLMVSKTIDVYVFDLQLSGGTGTIVKPTTANEAKYDVIMNASDISPHPLSASLDGFSSGVSFTWNDAAAALSDLGTLNTVSDTSCTITPNGNPVIYYICNIKASYGGVEKTFKFRYRPLKLEFTNTSPTAISKDTASGADTTMSVRIMGCSGDNFGWGNWVSSETSVASKGTESSSGDTASLILNPVAGGKTTVSMSAMIASGADSITLNATKDVYILDLKLNGDGLTTAGNGYALMTTMNNTNGTDVSAYLDGLAGMLSTTFNWVTGTNSTTYIELNAPTGTPNKITPKAAGTETVTVSTESGGVTVSKTINVSVVGLSLTEGPICIQKGNNFDITASVPNYGSGVNYAVSVSGTPLNLPDTNTQTGVNGQIITIGTTTGGKSTITVTAKLLATNTQLPPQTINVYVLNEPQLSGTGVDTSVTPNQLILPAGGTAVQLNASLEGFDESSEVTFTWSSPSPYATLGSTTGATNTITPGTTTGETDIQIQAQIKDELGNYVSGASINKTVRLKVQGIEIQGDDTIVFNESGGTANTRTYSMSPQGGLSLTGATQTFEELNDTAGVAEINASTGLMSPAKGGSYTIKATAVKNINGNDVTFTDSKTISILRPVIKQSGSELATANIITLDFGSSMNVTAELEGGLTASSWSWSKSSGSPAGDVTLSSTNIAGTQITGTTLGLVNVTATATYGGQQCSRTLQLEVKLTPDGLGDYLGSLTEGNAPPQAAYTLPAIQGLTEDNWMDIKTALQEHPNVYVDLSLTQLPNSIENMENGFKDCTNLVTAPKLPASVKDLDNCFSGCSSLTTPPDLSLCTNLEDMSLCFNSCTKLKTAPVIPSSVTDIAGCFSGCSSLTTPPDLSLCTNLEDMSDCFQYCKFTDLSEMVIPSTVKYMGNCFGDCNKLTKPPVIPASVTNMMFCFNRCTALSGIITINAHFSNSTFLYGCFQNSNANGITKIRVPDNATKIALKDSNGMPEALKDKIYSYGESGY